MVKKSITHNLSSALQLFELIDKYVPSDQSKLDGNEYMSAIMEKIRNGNHMDYLAITQLVSGVDRSVLLKSDAMEVFEAFTAGLAEWDIVNLVEFFRQVGYHGRRSG